MSYQDILRQRLLADEQRREKAYQAEAGAEYEPMQEDMGGLEIAQDVGMGLVSGVAEGVEGIYDFADFVTADLLPDWDVDFGERKTVWGKVAEGGAELAVAYIPVAGWLSRGGKVLGGVKLASKLSTQASRAVRAKKARKAGLTGAEALRKMNDDRIMTGVDFARGAVAGAIGDNIIFTEDEKNLSSLLTQFPGLKDTVATMLAVEESDSVLEQRLKTTVEGMGFGVLFDGLLYGINKIRKIQNYRAADPSASPEDLSRQAAEELGIPPDVDAPRETQGELFPELDPAGQPSTRPDVAQSDEEIVNSAFNAEDVQRDVDAVLAEEAARAGKDNIPNPRRNVSRMQLVANAVMRNGLNLDEISSDESIQTLIRATETVLQRQGRFKIAGQDAEKVIDDATKWFADRHGMDMPTAASALTEGLDGADLVDQAQAMLARTTALRAFYGSAANTVSKLRKKIVDGTASMQDEADYLRAMDAFMRTTAAFSDVKSFFGKGLRSLRGETPDGLQIPRRFLDPSDMEALLQRAGGRAKLRRDAKKLGLAIDGMSDDEAARVIQEVMTPTWRQTFTDVHQELWLNNLIGAPKTLVLAASGFANAYWKGFQRTLGAALDAGDAYLMNKGNPERRGMARKALYQALRYDYEITFGAVRHIAESLKYAGKSFVKNDPTLIQSRMFDASGGLTADNISKLALDAKWLRGDAPIGHYLLDRGLLLFLKAPNRIMGSIDEAAKQFQARATASAKIASEYDDKLSAGLIGPLEPRGDYIERRMKEVIRDGRLYSSSRVYEEMLSKAPENLVGKAREKWASQETQKILQANKDTSALAKYVGADALDSAFQTPTRPGGVSDQFDKLIRMMPLGYMAAPFRKTPVNILASAMQHLDVMAVKKWAQADTRVSQAIMQLQNGDRRFIAQMSSGDPMQRAEAIGRVASGIGVISYAMALTEPGEDGQVRITGGGPTDKVLRENWIRAGNQPYSIRVGDGWYSYQRLDPWATMLGIVADFKEMARFSEETEENQETLMFFLTQAGMSVSRNIVDKSYLMGLSGIMDAIEPDADAGAMEAFIRNTVAAHIPNTLGAVARERNTELKHVRTLMDAFKSRIPGLGEGLESKRNFLGEVIAAPGSLGGEAGTFADFVMPIQYTKVSDDVIAKELADLGHRFRNPRSLREDGTDWAEVKRGNQSAYDYWLEQTGKVKIDGKTLRERLKIAIGAKEYQDLDPSPFNDEPSPRVKIINDIRRAYLSRAKALTYRRYPELLTNERLRTINNGLRKKGLDPIELKR